MTKELFYKGIMPLYFMDNKEESKVIRKSDPTKRKDIQVFTLEKIKKYLKDQGGFVYKSNIVRAIGVDYNSLKIALTMLDVEESEDNQVKLKECEVVQSLDS